MTRAPRASILIDTYNHERFLAKAVESVLEQDALTPDMEVVIVDDGSSDRTPELARGFAPRVRYIRKENGGQASAFNAAAPVLRGDVCLFLDGDDWWLPGKLGKVLDAFRPEPGHSGDRSRLHRDVLRRSHSNGVADNPGPRVSARCGGRPGVRLGEALPRHESPRVTALRPRTDPARSGATLLRGRRVALDDRRRARRRAGPW